MSVTFLQQRSECFTKSNDRASETCNFVWLDGVFMMHPTSRNHARFHFYAEKNYNDIQTPEFFLPMNQWVTVQMNMSQFYGYKIIVLNEAGEVIETLENKRSMEGQKPRSSMSAFSGLGGVAKELYISTLNFAIPAPYSFLIED